MNFPFFPNKNKIGNKIHFEHKEAEGVARFEHNQKTTGKSAVGMLEVFAEHSGIPIYKEERRVENAYESDFLGFTDKCPLCNAPTQQMNSNYVWSNQVASRLLTGPVGHFCTECPTVIIDDDIMRKGINSSYQYWGVCGIETGYSTKNNDTILFKTLNGVKPTYILSESGGLDGILESVHAPSDQIYRTGGGDWLSGSGGTFGNLASNRVHSGQRAIQASNKKAKSKSKNKQAKQSRKANRKK